MSRDSLFGESTGAQKARLGSSEEESLLGPTWTSITVKNRNKDERKRDHSAIRYLNIQGGRKKAKSLEVVVSVKY